MVRDTRFDVVRALCMAYIVFVHLYGYIHIGGYLYYKGAFVIPMHAVLGSACLGLFSFCSGYLLSSKYHFDGNHLVRTFFKKRIVRIIPLFLIAAVVLYLIGFNGLRATVNGVLLISPFVTPRPRTLWYIPVIIICYAITPLICRKNFLWRLGSSLIALFAILVLQSFIPSVDKRLSFNLFFYLTGLVSAPYFDWRFKDARYVKAFVVVFFFTLLLFLHGSAPQVLKSYRFGFAGLGVFAILFVCEWLSVIFFSKNYIVARVAHIIQCVSYASMACYMFHRLFFWVGEMMYNPSEQWVKWVYMGGIVFPVLLFLSYSIQKTYDTIVDKISKRQ